MDRVFVSYSWNQGEWVWDRLVPVLKAGGIEILIDRERFKAGKDILGQMDKTQDQAGQHVLCLSAEYLESTACKHEMRRAIESDPAFSKGKIIPLLLDRTPVHASSPSRSPRAGKPICGVPIEPAFDPALQASGQDRCRDRPWTHSRCRRNWRASGSGPPNHFGSTPVYDRDSDW
jgi:hypothetical protein